MRIMNESNYFTKWFDRISYLAAPYEDLEIRQGILMAEFYTSRGFENTHWHKKYKNL